MYFHNQGPAIGWIHQAMEDMIEETRRTVAEHLGAEPEEIMLNENATIGINIVAYGIEWKAGDNIILSDQEHPGNRVVWFQLRKRYGIEIRIVQLCNDYDTLLARLKALIDRRTRLISISHVSRETGLRLPATELSRIAHTYGVPILFDGAQAFGAIPVNLHQIGCDFYTCSGHKYIMGPQGTGAFFVKRDRLEWLQPSWLGSHSEKVLDKAGHVELKDSAKRFEFSTHNLADVAGFRYALEMWDRIGWTNVYKYLEAYTTWLKQELVKIPSLRLLTPMEYEHSAGIISFEIPNYNASCVVRSLYEAERVLVAAINDQIVRASVHVFNTEEDGRRLLAGLTRIVTRGY